MSGVRTYYSKQCFDDLQQHGLTNKFDLWCTKDEGEMRGVTLVGSHKNGSGKVTYVKRYGELNGRNFYEVLDYLVFDVCRKLGACMPKVKLKHTENHHYLFSRSISDNKALTPSQFFFLTFADLQKSQQYYLNNNLTIATDAGKALQIDQDSVATLALLNTLFGLLDLHQNNVGFVIDLTTNTAKLALIDFAIDYKGFLHRNKKQQPTLAKTITNFHTNRISLSKLGLDQIPDATYEKALARIRTVFDDLCQDTLTNALKEYPSKQKRVKEAQAKKLIHAAATRLQQLSTRFLNQPSNSPRL